MLTTLLATLGSGFAIAVLAAPIAARAEITVMISGGFSLAYREVLPEFERTTGIVVTTLSAASQGTGPTTMRAQLERGARADVVILSREGLEELVAAGRIVDGTAVELARVPLGLAVRSGAPRPEIGDAESLKRVLLRARLVVMPGSTSGIFILQEALPRLGIADRVATRTLPRGTDATAMVASGEADVALAPVSELTGVTGVDYVGPLPAEVQLVQVFTAALVAGSDHADEAKRLVAHLASGRTAEAARRYGMEPPTGR